MPVKFKSKKFTRTRARILSVKGKIVKLIVASWSPSKMVTLQSDSFPASFQDSLKAGKVFTVMVNDGVEKVEDLTFYGWRG